MKTDKGIKAHSHSKHRERPVDSDNDDPEGKKSKDDMEDIDDIDDEELAEWIAKDNGSQASIRVAEVASPASQQDEESSSHAERMVIDSEHETEGTLGDAVERIKHLEGESKAQEELIKNLELQLETKSDLLSIANVKVESLELGMVDKESRNKNLAAAYKSMRKEVDKLKSENGGGTNTDLAKKLKKATDDLKAKTKLLEESEKAKEELNIKVGKEISSRAKAEADAVMLQDCVKALQSVVDSKTTTKVHNKERCSFLDKPGGCKKGASCKFQHTEGESSKAGKQDCNFWMAGGCKFSEAECSKSHDPFCLSSSRKRPDYLTN